MPMVFGFAAHRRQLLEAEFLRIAGELPLLGAERFWLSGDLAAETVTAESELELVIVKEMDAPYHRRADFFSTHLRPRVGTRFLVYTPAEFERCAESDQHIRRATALSDAIHA